jgi:uncharacterized protein YggU (UPF0235/DUF167 family)
LAGGAEGGSIIVDLVAHPGASRRRVERDDSGVLHVWVTARAVDNKANDAILRALADAIGLRVGALELVAGARHRHKRVLVSGITEADLTARIGPPTQS